MRLPNLRIESTKSGVIILIQPTGCAWIHFPRASRFRHRRHGYDEDHRQVVWLRLGVDETFHSLCAGKRRLNRMTEWHFDAGNHKGLHTFEKRERD